MIPERTCYSFGENQQNVDIADNFRKKKTRKKLGQPPDFVMSLKVRESPNNLDHFQSRNATVYTYVDIFHTDGNFPKMVPRRSESENRSYTRGITK